MFHFDVSGFYDGVVASQQTMTAIELHTQRFPKRAVFFAECWFDAAFQMIHGKSKQFHLGCKGNSIFKPRRIFFLGQVIENRFVAPVGLRGIP